MYTVNDGDHPRDGNAELFDAAAEKVPVDACMGLCCCCCCVDHLYIALFSALEQSHCALM